MNQNYRFKLFFCINLLLSILFTSPVHADAPVAGFGFALDFDGVDDYVEVSDMPYVQISSGTNATFELWLKTTNPDSFLFSKNLDWHSPNNVEFELGIVGSKLRFNSQLSTGSVNDGKLHHVAVVLNGLSGTYYIDGELDSTFTVTANAEKAISLLIGARRQNNSSTIGDFYAGELDDIRIWNTARTQTQIQDNMYTSLLGDEAGLIAYWALDENTGTTITDSTGNTTDGTFNSAPAWIDAEALVWETSLNTPINETLPAYDNDGDTITYSLVDNDSGAAVLTDTSTGAFTYTPHTAGTRTFSYKVNDGFDDSNIEVVTIEVEPNIPPIAGFGSALDFDGVDDYVTANVATTAIDNVTLETWAYWANDSGNNPVIFYNGNSSSSGYGLIINSASQKLMVLCGGVNVVNSDYIYSYNEWHHVALVRTGGVWLLYIDGIAQTLTDNYSPNSPTGALSFAATGSNTQHFQGKIDDVRVWDTARTQTEIQDNMNKALQGNELNLVGYWALDENTGTTATDKTSNANDGTLNNNPTWIGSDALAWITSLNTPFNDTLPAYDSDGDTLTYSLVNNDSGAVVLTNASTGAFTYTPASSGTHTFSYKVNDGFVDSNVATVTITVSSLIVDSIADTDDGNYATGQNTLREAIAKANAGDTITFDSSIAGQTILLNNQLTLDKNLTIDGETNNISISGQDTVRIFDITAGTVVLSNLTLKNGSASAAGAIQISGSGTNVTAQEITFDSNHSTGIGGAVAVSGAGNNLIVKASTFVNNSAAIASGGLRCEVGATAKIYNSTFFNNTANNGAAINSDGCNLFEIYNSTLHGNTGSYTLHSYASNSTFKLYNTIISGTVGGVDCSGDLTVQTNTLIQDGTCAASITGDPKLDTALSDNEGTTQSLALLSDSPAINAGDAATCEAQDQRGVSRTAHGTCDIGAYELELIPSIPSNLTASASDSNVALSWTDSLYETSYILSRDGGASTTLTVDTTSYTDSAVNCDSSYSYSLYASNDYSNSAAVSVTAEMPACPPIPPNEPLNFAAIPTHNQIQLTWVDDSSIESGYKILRDGKLIASLDADTETYIDENLSCETVYNYEIYAYNSIGESGRLTASTTTLTCPPLTPGNLRATVTTDNITLTWEDVEGETSYLVIREPLTTRRTRAVTEFNLLADSTTFIDSGFECGQSYNYAVAAVADTSASAAATITVDAEPCLNAPVAPNLLEVSSVTDSSISLTWNDNSDNETGFYVFNNGSLVKELPENSTSATIQNLECETTYSFQIVAFNDIGQANSETISATTATCPLVNLVAPSNFVATNLSNNQIQLTWQDNSINETGFPIARDGAFITIAPINATSFIDTNLTCGTEYYYQLYATDSVINVGGLEQIINTPPCPPEGNFYVHLNTIGSGIINNCNDTLCSLTASSGTTVNLLVTPSEGWEFSHWSGDCSSSQLIVDAEKNCLAHFSQIIVEPEPEVEPEPQPQQPIIINPLDPNLPSTATPVPRIGADLCGTSFTNHNSTTGNLNICETGSVAGGNLIGDNINAGLVSNFTLNPNATITGGRLSGFNTNYGTLQDLTITQYSEVSGGFYAGSINNNGTMIDPYINEGSTIYSSTGQGSIVGITQNKGTIQGTIKLGVNTVIIGGKISGKIIAPVKSKAYLGNVEILPGATLQNVYLSPTVKLPRDVILINVTQASNPAEPNLKDFGVDMKQLDDLNARTIVAVEPAAIALFDRYEVAEIPSEAFAGMTPEQTASFKPEATGSITVEQFNQLSPEALAGFTDENVTALSPEVMQSLSSEQLEAFNPEALQQAEQIAKLLTNIQPDTPQEIINKILPEDWKISENGKIIPPVGSKLGFKGVINRLPNSVLTPYLVDLQSSFSIGGATNDVTVGGGFNVGLQQTPSIDSVDLNQFIFTQNEYGIFNVVGTGDYAGIVFAFMPNANNIEQAPLDTPVGLTTIEGGYFEMITPDKQKFVLITAPNNPVGLQEALGGESTVKLSPTGDVLMRLDNSKNNTRSRNLRFETNVMMVGCFDAFVEPAPADFCADPAFCNFGMQFPSDFGNLRARQEAKVIYPDGSAQTIYPTVIYPEVLVNLLEQYESIPNVLYKSDGTFEATVLINEQEQKYSLIPDINVKVRRLEAGEKRYSKVSLQGNILLYEAQEGDDLLTFSLNISLI